MYRLLIVDDEDIITDGLYEVFSHFQPEQLDVCRAYSGIEAMNWMSRTRVDIVLTDIAMPGMNGLELSDEVQKYWPRSRIIFLTGHSEFEYAYRAIQMPNVRYVLKAEGYGKVTETVQEVLDELSRSHQGSQLIQQSREQLFALQFMAQGDYMRHLLQNSSALCADRDTLVHEFNKLHIELDPTYPVVQVLGRIACSDTRSYTERNEILLSIRRLWDTFFSEQTRSMAVIDKYGDIFWFVQPIRHEECLQGSHFIKFVEGTLEMVQEASLNALGVPLGFVLSCEPCEWSIVSKRYDRLRQIQQLRIGSSVSIIVSDGSKSMNGVGCKDNFAGGDQKVELLAGYLETGRSIEFLKVLDEISRVVLQTNGYVQFTIQTYYAIALMLYSSIIHMGLHGRIDDNGKLMRLDDHSSMQEGFDYLKQIANSLFIVKQSEERDRASLMVERICEYIEEHLSEDLTLVRLAEIHFFNPSYLSRFFKQEKGMNLSEFIDKCRAKRAKELLRDGNLKVREVAISVGYEAAHSFTRFFKKVTGLTPQDYRDNLTLS